MKVMAVVVLFFLVAAAGTNGTAPVGGTVAYGGWVATSTEINLLPPGVTSNSLAPQIVKFSASNNRWYVIGAESNALSVIDGDTSAVSNIALESNFGTTQRWLEVDSSRNRVYVVSERSSIPIMKLYAIDTTTSTVVGDVALARKPAEVGVNPYTGKIYVLNYDDFGVTIYNPNLTIDRFVSLGARPVQFGVNPTPAVNKIFVLTQSKLVVIDGTTDAVLKNITWTGYAGLWPGSHNMEVNTRSNMVYVVEQYASGNDSRLSEIDGNAYTYRQMTLSGAVEPYNVRVDEVRNKVYAANDKSANVTDIDPVAWTFRNVSVGGEPNALAVNPDDGYVYSHRWNSPTMVYFDPAQVSPTVFTVENVPNFGHMIESMAANPNIDRVMVASGLYGGASVLNFDTLNKISLGRIRTGNAPMDSLSVDTVKGTAYVTTREDFAIRINSDNTTSNVGVPWLSRWVQANPAQSQIQIGFGAFQSSAGVRVIGDADPLPTIATVSSTTVTPQGMAIMTSTGRTYMTHADQNSARFSVVGIPPGSTNYTTLHDIQISPTQYWAAEDLLADNAQNKVYGRAFSGIGIINGNLSPPTYRETAIGSDLKDLALDPGYSKLYAADFSGRALYVFDGASERVESKTTFASGPNRVALDLVARRAFVTNYSSNTLTVLDISVSPPTVLRTVNLPLGTKPSAIAVDAAKGAVYVSSHDSTTSYLYSISEGTWGVNALLSKSYPYGVLAGSETSSGDDSVSLSTIAIGQNGRVFVSDYLAGKIWVVDVAAQSTVSPGPATQVALDASHVSIMANGVSTAVITATIMDGSGNLVADGTAVNLDTTLGTISPSTGASASGVATSTLTSGTKAGTASVHVTSGTGSASKDLLFFAGPTTRMANISVSNLARTSAAPGETLTYQVVLRNSSASKVSKVSLVLTDTVPAGSSYIPGTAGSGAVYSSTINSVLWSGWVEPFVSTQPCQVLQFQVRINSDYKAGSLVSNLTVSDGSASTGATATTQIRQRTFTPLLTKGASGQ